MSAAQTEADGWTEDLMVTILDDGSVLTPWGSFRVRGAARAKAEHGGRCVDALVVELEPALLPCVVITQSLVD